MSESQGQELSTAVSVRAVEDDTVNGLDVVREGGLTLERGALDVSTLVRRWGGTVSTALLDPRTSLFSAPGVRGAIGYRAGLGCAVIVGDPVCPPSETARLVAAFRQHCKERGWHMAAACASAHFADIIVALGGAAVQFGEELILDPQTDPTVGSAGRELRKKVNHATRDGVEVTEYPAVGTDGPLERAMEDVAVSWLRARKGPQIYLARVRLFADPEGKRWFYARHEGRLVGVLSLMELAAKGGWLLDHLLATPDAPVGVTELLVASALKTLRKEGCRFATFGPVPSAELGHVAGLGSLSEKLARAVFHQAGRVFHLDSQARFRRKFGAANVAPSFLCFDPPRIGVREIAGIMKAFNVSIYT